MPVYVFSCRDCGTFELSRPMADAGDAARCPACRGESRRVFTPPGLARLDRPVRRVLENEEASAHEPEVVSQRRGRPLPQQRSSTPPWVLH
ncbi:MAG TPA: zinc ribbon domain-containing protein [Streptosporangiaceae bacterium]|jgi:putative FmdB family regulatory protein